MKRPKALYLHKIPGLMSDCNPDLYHYEWRNKWADLPKTKEFYEQFPPEVGQTVVILSTFAQEMQKPDVKQIEVIHERGGIIVNHCHADYAGTLFLRDGKNWKAPRSQVWLVPAELYRDIPKNEARYEQKQDYSKFVGCPQDKDLKVQDIIEMVGSLDRFKEIIKPMMSEGKSYSEAKNLLAEQLMREQTMLGRGLIRGVTRLQNRYGLEVNLDHYRKDRG